VNRSATSILALLAAGGRLARAVGKRAARTTSRRFITAKLEAATHGTIRGLTNHGLDQLLWRDRLRGVATDAVADAVVRPLAIVPQARGTTLYKGDRANVVVNQHGVIVTAYAKRAGGRRWRFRRIMR